MGNAVSKGVDIALKVACVATGGIFGKSEEGLHIGPLRLEKDSIGISHNFGMWSVNIKLCKNESGNVSLDVSVTYGIPGSASVTLRAGVEGNSFYGGLSCSLNVGPTKVNADILATSKGVVSSFGCSATGPLLTNVQFSKEQGLSGGIFGLSIDKDKKISYTHLEDALITKVGKKVREKYKSSNKDIKSTNEKKKVKIQLSKNSRVEFRKTQGKKKDFAAKNKYKMNKTTHKMNSKYKEAKQKANVRMRTNEQSNKDTIATSPSAKLVPTEKLLVNRKRETSMRKAKTPESLTIGKTPVSKKRTELADTTSEYCKFCKGPCKYYR